jgi:ATP-binding cassette, subfamily B, multidrug efflux pump
MDDGRIVGIGTHHELLADNETYREIVYSQMSEQEAVA